MIDINHIQEQLYIIPGIRNPIPAMSQCGNVVAAISTLSETLKQVPMEAPFNEHLYKQITEQDFFVLTSCYIVMGCTLGQNIESAMYEVAPYLIQGAKKGVEQANIPKNILQFPK